MHAIEFFVGLNRGGWIRSSERHSSADLARQAIRDQVSKERRADLTPLLRRAVPV